MTQPRTHKLQLDSVTLNFRLWDGPPSIEVHDPPRYYDTPEYSNGRSFVRVEVHHVGVYIRTLNERGPSGSGITRSLTPGELRQVLDDIDETVTRVQRARLTEPWPNHEDAANEDGETDEDEEQT